jgi:hypothetical protein
LPGGGPLERTPFFFIGPRPYREAELAAHIIREHGRGRDLDQILNDPYLERRGGRALVRAVLRRPDLIRALGRDVADAIVRHRDELTRGTGSAPPGPHQNGRRAGPAPDSSETG